jgi:FKBP-type peptidyl-prolyl cis-trans isomerase FkpA
MIRRFLYYLLVLIILFSCRQQKKPQIKNEWSSDHSVDFNQELAIREQIQIKLFLDHYTSLKMKLSNSGLRYMIYKKGQGKKLGSVGQLASIKIKISLLDGTICFETKDTEYEHFGIEKSEKELGIHELVTYMRVGDKAKAILPSYLGHGLLGDRQSIPPQSILYLDVELIDLKI